MSVRRLVAASSLLVVGVLGHASCSPSNDGEKQPVVEKNAPLVTFESVRATFLYGDSFRWRNSAPVQHIAQVERGTLVTMRARRNDFDPVPLNRPEVWFVPKDGEPPIHFESVGSDTDAEPVQTKITWGTHTITLDLDGGAITGGVYRDPDGNETRVDGDGTATSSSALQWDDIDAEAESVLKWAMECQGHIVIKKLAEGVAAVKTMVTRVVDLVDAVKKAAPRAHVVYSKQPVYGEEPLSFPLEPVADDIVKLAAEVEARSRGEESPPTRWLPAVVGTLNETRTELVPARWEPPAVRCIKERRDGPLLIHTEQACALSMQACEDAGGHGVAAEGSCRQWCNTRVVSGTFLSDAEYCADTSCVAQFAPNPHPYELIDRAQCCEKGLSEACEAPTTDAGPPPTDTGTPTRKVCGSQFEILSEGTHDPTGPCPGEGCNGSGEVRDLGTGLVWSRNLEASVLRGDLTKAQSLCAKHGMRVPTLTELRGVAKRVCAEGFNWPERPYHTSTDHPDPDPQWYWCVKVPTGTEDLCINNVDVVCVK